MLNSKPTSTQSFQVKPLEMSYSSVNFFNDRDEDLLFSEKFCSDWGVRNSPVWIAYKVRNMIALRNLRAQISDRCYAMRQLSKISYPT